MFWPHPFRVVTIGSWQWSVQSFHGRLFWILLTIMNRPTRTSYKLFKRKNIWLSNLHEVFKYLLLLCFKIVIIFLERTSIMCQKVVNIFLSTRMPCAFASDSRYVYFKTYVSVITMWRLWVCSWKDTSLLWNSVSSKLRVPSIAVTTSPTTWRMAESTWLIFGIRSRMIRTTRNS